LLINFCQGWHKNKLRGITVKIKKIMAACILGASMVSASAANFSFTGNFANDNDVQQFAFSVGAPSSVSLRSWSYAGGTNAAGTSIARGGFDPILALFNSAGVRIGQQDDAGCPLVSADAVTGQCWDTFFTTSLTSGNYIATIQQFNNFSNGSLSAGFAFDGAANANFRNGFVDEFRNKRDSHWAFDILNVNSAVIPAAVPEPATVALLGLGLLGFAASRRKSAKSKNA
jgi:hypothetical protein